MNQFSFSETFESLTGHHPFPWQSELAVCSDCRDRLVRIPTGFGKTEGVLAAWSFHRLYRKDERWPRRLVWCLPMRVLVEQTEQVARRLAERIPENSRPTVHVAMGGKDSGDWVLHPERHSIIIGTQDMLLSRALNRGYASARARWPMEFGLLNHDALWVMDEVQLMDVGLATSAQLQAFRQEDQEKHLRPCHTWWMSATLQPEWLRSVDTEPHHEDWIRERCEIPIDQRNEGLWEIQKKLTTGALDAGDASSFADQILNEHDQVVAGEHGRITLVVCNTVARACETFDALCKKGRAEGVELVHSRFRPHERQAWRGKFLSRSACKKDVDRIIVATQVVEAGVDLSAGLLVTELAPWPSLVQRFGRCARYGGSGRVLVIDRGRDESSARPYLPKELESAWESLQQLSEKGVGIAALEEHEESLNSEARDRLYAYSPSHLLLRREFDELFDTTPDLTGADLDISRFIRSGDERDVQVLWLEVGADEKLDDRSRPHRWELCAVPFLQARDWLCGEETKKKRKPKLRKGIRAWIWDWLDGEWKDASRESLLPGRIVCVAADCGGYRPDRGFDPSSIEPVEPVPMQHSSHSAPALDAADDQQDGEDLSFTEWKTIAFHTKEVVNEIQAILEELSLANDNLPPILELAALWHDWGKSHPAFQGSIRDGVSIKRLSREDLAKAPDECWPKNHRYEYLDQVERRPAFRHELASALGLFAILQTYDPQNQALLGPWSEVLEQLGKSQPTAGQPTSSPLIQRALNCSPEDFDLLVYLIASHHGKVRVALHAAPQDQEYRDFDGRGLPIRGIREGDRLPPVALVPGEDPLPEVTLTLSPASIGLSEHTGISWRERCLGLLERFGPCALAFLEAILRAADVRASQRKTNDPTLDQEARQ